MNELNDYLDSLYNLSVGVVGTGSKRHERPHKPVMLMAIADLIASGDIQENRIEWTQTLRARFMEIFEKVRSLNDKPTPENPFFYLRTENFWHHVASPGNEKVVERLRNPPSIWDLNDGLFYVKLDDELFARLKRNAPRRQFKEALISRYFPARRQELSSSEEMATEPDEESSSPARSAAFRKLILETYDYQCVACGLRIRLPNDLTIVDAAHLIPFSESANDHPTNGFALCKNHHWAFDRYLITPTNSGIWKVSPTIKARRSPGEADLAALHGECLLPPREEAYSPSEEAVRWREARLLA